MRVLIVGSNHFDGSSDSWPNITSAAEDLGRSLAKAHHTIVVGSESPNTADRHVFEGFQSIPGRHKVSVLKIVFLVQVLGSVFITTPSCSNRAVTKTEAIGSVTKIIAVPSAKAVALFAYASDVKSPANAVD